MRVVASQLHRRHDALEIHNGAMVRSAESPERADMIAEVLHAVGHEFMDPIAVDRALLEQVHSAHYTDFLADAWQRWVDRGETAPAAMGFVWPARQPHQETPTDLIGQLGYFSFAGDTTVLDVDYHHGNGTQSIFYDRSDVLFVSLHGDPEHEFPWFSGYARETGVGAGDGWNLNLPLAPGSGFAAWSEALEVGLKRIQKARVDALVVSLGVDTYEHDPIGTFKLSTANFAMVARRVGALGLPTVLLQEGGYAVEDLGANVAAFLEPLS